MSYHDRSLNWVRFAILVVVVAFLQAALFDLIARTGHHLRPSLMLILMVFFATRGRAQEAVIASFVTGFAADLIGPDALGPLTVSYGVIGSAMGQLRRFLLVSNPIQQCISVLSAGILSAALTRVLGLIKGQGGSTSLIQVMLWEPLYTAALTPLLWFPLALLTGQRTHRRRSRAR